MADKKAFTRTIDANPATDLRIIFGKDGVLSLNMTFAQFFTYLKDNVNYDDVYLSRTNTEAYTPTLATHPATMGYVDEVAGIGPADVHNLAFITAHATNASGNAALKQGNVHVTGVFDETGDLDIDETVFNLPAAIPAPTYDVYFTCENFSGGSGLHCRIVSGSKAAVVLRDGDGTPTLVFNFSYAV